MQNRHYASALLSLALTSLSVLLVSIYSSPSFPVQVAEAAKLNYAYGLDFPGMQPKHTRDSKQTDGSESESELADGFEGTWFNHTVIPGSKEVIESTGPAKAKKTYRYPVIQHNNVKVSRGRDAMSPKLKTNLYKYHNLLMTDLARQGKVAPQKFHQPATEEPEPESEPEPEPESEPESDPEPEPPQTDDY